MKPGSSVVCDDDDHVRRVLRGDCPAARWVLAGDFGVRVGDRGDAHELALEEIWWQALTAVWAWGVTNDDSLLRVRPTTSSGSPGAHAIDRTKTYYNQPTPCQPRGGRGGGERIATSQARSPVGPAPRSPPLPPSPAPTGIYAPSPTAPLAGKGIWTFNAAKGTA